MTPFDINPDNDAGHAIDQDDLIAFHLHELSPQQERALHRVLRTNPALQAESVAIAATLHAFPKHEAALPLDAAALDRHWQAIRNSLPAYAPIATIAPQNFFSRWAIPAFAASALAATTLLVALHYAHRTQPVTVARTENVVAPTRIPAPAVTPQPNVPSNSESNAANSVFFTPHRAWRSDSAPMETAATAPPSPIFPAQAPAPLAPASPSASTAEATSAAVTPASPSNVGLAQSPAEPPTPSAIQSGRSVRTSAVHRSPATELTLAMFGSITASRSSTYNPTFGTTQITQAATPAVGALASFRQQFSPWLGYRITTTYFSPTFEYFNGLDIRQRIYELSATYVAQGPHHHRLTTSMEAGASLLNFRYSDANYYPAPATDTSTYRPAAVVGVGAEYGISKHWGLRAEYRALVYRPPYVADPGNAITSPTSLTFSSNPILGITYRFGNAGAD